MKPKLEIAYLISERDRIEAAIEKYRSDNFAPGTTVFIDLPLPGGSHRGIVIPHGTDFPIDRVLVKSDACIHGPKDEYCSHCDWDYAFEDLSLTPLDKSPPFVAT